MSPKMYSSENCKVKFYIGVITAFLCINILRSKLIHLRYTGIVNNFILAVGMAFFCQTELANVLYVTSKNPPRRPIRSSQKAVFNLNKSLTYAKTFN